jgi:hypothetical protein
MMIPTHVEMLPNAGTLEPYNEGVVGLGLHWRGLLTCCAIRFSSHTLMSVSALPFTQDRPVLASNILIRKIALLQISDVIVLILDILFTT